MAWWDSIGKAAQAAVNNWRGQTATTPPKKPAANNGMGTVNKPNVSQAVSNVGKWYANTPRVTAAGFNGAGQQKSFTNYSATNQQPWANNGQGLTKPQQAAAQPQGIFGVDYGPNWKRGTYTPPVTFRQDNPGIQMTQQEYMLRRNAWQNMYGPNFLQSNQEWTVRNNAAPTGYTYVPFGSSFVKNPTLPGYGSGPSTPTPQGAGGGGGYGGGGGWGGGGGGGGGGSDVNNWYMGMLQWTIK